MARISFLSLACLVCLFSTITIQAQDFLQSGFTCPPATAGARTWWHWINGNVSEEGITADLEAMKRVGIQEAQIFNVDQGYPEGTAKFLSPGWLELFRFAVLEAGRLGLEIGFHNGAGWSSSGGPWITPEYAMQTVVFSEVRCKGGILIKEKLAQPPAKLDYYKDIAVLAFPAPQNGIPIDGRELKALSGSAFRNHLQPDDKPVALSAMVRKADVVNLTANMSADGTLTWEAPAGAWTILRIGHTPTGKENHPAVVGGRGLECDKLSRAAVDVYWAGGIEPILNKLGNLVGSTLTNCLIDSYEVGCNNWTPGFDKEFARRRGYDCIAFLPALAGYYVESGDVSERFLWDFRRTIGDLTAENYFGYFSELCHKHGLKFTVEPYGGPFECLQAGASGDIIMGEFWLGGKTFLDSPKLAASIAHLNGTPLVAAEAFTATGEYSRWLNHPATLKALGDWAWTEGVNRLIFHTYTHQPWNVAPGMTFHMYGTEMSRLNTWWEQGCEYMNYLARAQFLLQQGRCAADILVFAGESSPNDGMHRPDIKALGYDYDEIGTNKIGSLTVENGCIRTPAGGSYRVLLLPETSRMTPELIRKVGALARAGATVVGPKPSKSPSLQGFPGCDNEVARLADEIWDKTNQPGKGRVVPGHSVKDILADAGLSPDFSGGTSGSDLLFIHRMVGDADVYFVANPRKQSRNEMCRFRVAGKQPELWNPETGKVETAAVWQSDRESTSIPIFFEPEGACFVVFRKPVSHPADNIVKTETILSPSELKPLPGLHIISAVYGTFLPDGIADVTAALAGRIKNGQLRTPVENNLAPSDPAPGTPKELRIEYEIGGKRRKLRVQELQLLAIPETGDTGELRVIRAMYGKFPQGFDEKPQDFPVTDITAQVAALVASKTFVFPVDDRLTGKSSPGENQNKELRMTYSVEGEIHRIAVARGREVNLTTDTPEPKLVAGGGNTTWITPQAGNIVCTTASGVTRTARVESVPQPIELTGPWDVGFPPNLGAPAKATFAKLISWPASSEEGIRYFSGTAVYRKRFSVPNDYLQAGRSLELDLGRVRVIAEVIVNGKNLGILWKAPFRIDLGNSVRAGQNDLEVRITNLWPNRLIGDARLSEDCDWGDWTLKSWPDWLMNKTERSSERITFTTWKHWDANSPLQPSGLIGPVILRPYVHVKLSE